jgi:hypothetical protein
MEAEQVLASIAVETGLQTVVLRLPLVYGPGVKANFKNLIKIAGAGLDVYENEPFIHPGLKRANVVLAPHIASASLETRTKMACIAAQNVVSLFTGQRPPNMLNPEVLKG